MRPVPSTHPDDFIDNVESVDEFVSSEQATLTTRTGATRKTLAGLNDDVQTAIDEISSDAGNLKYDNTTSGLTATDVKSAIDEVAANADNLQNSINTLNTTTSDHESRLTTVEAQVNDLNSDEIGGFPVMLSDVQEKDILQLKTAAWRNTPQEVLADGGNF